jgi:lipopolysaccharide transport system permease protein
MAGITAWNYFADCITKTSTVFRDNSNIFGKVYFPRLIIPLSIVVSNLLRFTAQFILFLLILSYYYFNKSFDKFNYTLLFFPILLILMAMFGLGLGLIISALTTKYRDLSFLVTFGVQLLMYATTVIYPLSVVPEKYKFLVLANPLTAIIELFRLGFLGSGYFSIESFSYSVIVILILFLLGVLIFNKTEKSFIDTI